MLHTNSNYGEATAQELADMRERALPYQTWNAEQDARQAAGLPVIPWTVWRAAHR